MKTRATLASRRRLHAMLACSAAILLSACGGSADSMNSQHSLATTAVADVTQAATPAPNMPALLAPAAETAPVGMTQAEQDYQANLAAAAGSAAASVAASAPGHDASADASPVPASGDASAQGNDHFALSGYDSAPAADEAAAPAPR